MTNNGEISVLGFQFDANGHVTRVEVPANALDAKDTVIAVEYEGSVKVDPAAKGKYHWSKSTGLKNNKHG